MAHEYAKIVLQSDFNATNWVDEDNWYEEMEVFNGSNVILDLNGYTLDAHYPGCEEVLVFFYSTRLEIWDSSAAGTGEIKLGNLLIANYYAREKPQVIIRGGTISTIEIDGYNKGLEVYMYGGAVNFLGVDDDVGTLFHMQGGCVRYLYLAVVPDLRDSLKIELSPYIIGDITQTENSWAVTIAARNLTAVAEYCAVSSSKLVSGVYNYAYGLVWEVSAAELNKMTIPSDKVYYLWGRDKDGWYRYLDMYYVDGQLKSAIQAA